MPGNWRAGKLIATWLGSAARRGSPKLQRTRAVVDLRAGPGGTRGAQDLITEATLFAGWRTNLDRGKKPPFDFAVVDEAQDIGVAQLRFLGGARGRSPECTVLCRRSWPAHLPAAIFMEVTRRGYSRALAEHCGSTTARRTKSACRPIGCSDPTSPMWTATREDRSDTVSVFNGPPPTIQTSKTRDGRSRSRLATGSRIAQERHRCRMSSASSSDPPAQLDRAMAAAEEAGLPFKILDEHVETASGHVSIGTMHLAKGLEFRAVAVMACDDEIIPLAAAHRDRWRRRGSAGGLRHRAALAVRRLHACQRPSAGYRRRAGVGISG